MFNQKFGFIPKKTVKFDGSVVSIGNFDITKEDIVCVYFRPFNFSKNEWGTVYFSLNGEDYDSAKLTTKNVFKFTKKQTDSVWDFLNLLDIEVVQKPNDLGAVPSTISTRSNQVVTCPNCQSMNLNFMQNNRKNFSVGKAIGGAVLTGGIGTLAGFAGKKGNNQWHCTDCGNIFETSNKK
ncbi:MULTISPECIES: hypothetical protein [unclassified Enterococcus]|uniref:hypothetical protein n=1 Tax=unclassified Enterococcus TaxID=2608891 RepID=UPI001A925FA7|nr:MULTISPECIES: hypothetical protein [unclassified Enterococcus]MBO0461103.1 hypothetical protein [Enterococcus sp. DIV1298c]MBO1300108.1 hypothetical protein [Enterococcus sp. DIV1271a]